MVVNVNPRQAQDLIASGTVEIVDVREHDAWAYGHIPGARPLPLADLRANPSQLHDGVLFVCAGGVRSQTAARLAGYAGLNRVYSLIGGTSSWSKAGFAIESALDVAV